MMLKSTPEEIRWICADTEFLDDGQSVELFSLAFQREDTGATFYILHPDYKLLQEKAREVDPWVYKNVFRDEVCMQFNPVIPNSMDELQERTNLYCGPAPQFTFYCGAFDRVALARVFGRMMAAPESYPYTYLELSLLLRMVGLTPKNYPQRADLGELPKHNPLADARWTTRVKKNIVDRARRGVWGRKSQTILDIVHTINR